MMQTDVKATGLTTSGVVFAGPARVKAITITVDGGGTVNIRDGNDATGTIVWSLELPNISTAVHVLLPGEGIKCQTAIFAQFTASHVTVVYG